MYYLLSSINDRFNFDFIVKDVLNESRFAEQHRKIEDSLLYFDLTDLVDDTGEAEARILCIAKEIIKKYNEKGKFKLNRDWEAFEPVLRSELKKHDATKEEINEIVDRAFQATTDIDNVVEYASLELGLLRNDAAIHEIIKTAINTITPVYLVGEKKGKTAFISEITKDITIERELSMVYFQGQSIPDNSYIEHLIAEVRDSERLFLVIDNAENLSDNQWETLLAAENVRLIVISSSAPEAVKDKEIFCPWEMTI